MFLSRASITTASCLKPLAVAKDALPVLVSDFFKASRAKYSASLTFRNLSNVSLNLTYDPSSPSLPELGLPELEFPPKPGTPSPSPAARNVFS